MDIRKEGSGNVGTLNSYELTNSKKIGLTILIVDLLKGILSVFIIKFFVSSDFIYPMVSLIFAVFGHCYSIWLKFKGGRGIATTGGGAMILSPAILVIWGFSWLIVKKIAKDIHVANIGATITTILGGVLFGKTLNNLTFPPANESFIFSFSLSLLMLIILAKHWQPFKEKIKKSGN